MENGINEVKNNSRIHIYEEEQRKKKKTEINSQQNIEMKKTGKTETRKNMKRI